MLVSIYTDGAARGNPDGPGAVSYTHLKGEYAYTMIDIDSDVTDSVIEDLTKVKDVLRVRVIR